MRVLSAPYDTAKAGVTDRSCIRVQIAGHGLAGYSDPFDVTDRVDSVSVTRALRGQADTVTLTIGNKGGEFDPDTSAWGQALDAGALVTIEAGEVLAGVPTFWDLFRGYVHEQTPAYGVTDAAVTWDLRNVTRDLWGLQITSPRYGANLAGAWNPVDIVEDLFTRFGGMVAGDFNLTPIVGPVLYRIQFEGDNLVQAAQTVLGAFGQRAWFDYDGRLVSGPLVPAVWASLLTIPAGQVKSATGPTQRNPRATRLFVSAGPEPESRPVIGDPEIVGSTRVYVDWRVHAPYWQEIGGGDCVESTGTIIVPGTVVRLEYLLTLAGPRGRQFRDHYAFCSAARVRSSANCHLGNLPPPDGRPSPAVIAGTDLWNATMERFEAQACLVIDADDALGTFAMDVEFDILSYPITHVYAPIDVQLWDDALITRFGEIPAQVTNRCAQSYDAACLVGRNEWAFLQRSVAGVSATLAGMDLRLEPGDVVTVGLPERGTDALVWVQRVTQSFGKGAGGETQIEGYSV